MRHQAVRHGTLGGSSGLGRSAFTLLLDATVPPEIDTYDARCHGKIEANAATFKGGDHEFRVGVVAERAYGGVSGFVGHFSVVLLAIRLLKTWRNGEM